MDINNNRVLASAILLTTIGMLIPNIQPMYVGAMADHLGFSNEQLGFLAGVEAAGLGLSGILAVFWIDRLSWQRAATIAIIVIALGNIISAFCPDFSTLLLIRGFIGFFGEGVAFAVGLAALSEARNVDRAYALMVLTHVASMFVCLIAMPYIIAIWGVAAILLPVGFVAALLLPAARVIPDGGHKIEQVSDTVTLKGPVFWGLGAQLVWYIGVGGLWAFIERIGDSAGLEKTDIGLSLGVAMAISIAGTVAATVLADRYGRAIPFVLSMIVQMMAAFFLLDIHSLMQYALVWIVFNTAWNYALPYIYAAVADADYSGRYVVMVPTGQSFGFAIGASVSGMLITDYGLSSVIYLCVAANVLAAVLFTTVVAKTKESPAAMA